MTPTLAWLLLLIAGALEIGWALCFKLAETPAGLRWGWVGVAALCLVASIALLFVAQRTIPIGTAYAVWTGIGSIGAAAVGILLFGEPASAARVGCVGLIVAGVVGLKLLAPAGA